MWDQLTPADLDRAQKQLGARRAALLARHAEELQALESEQDELGKLEDAIQAFLRKFNPAAEGAAAEAVVKIGEGRELRVQGRA